VVQFIDGRMSVEFHEICCQVVRGCTPNHRTQLLDLAGLAGIGREVSVDFGPGYAKWIDILARLFWIRRQNGFPIIVERSRNRTF
jgi:hypothetical protein